MAEENGTWKRVSQTSNNTKGRFGEMMADDWAAKQNPPWEKGNGPASTMNTPGHRGLDAVYRNPTPPRITSSPMPNMGRPGWDD
ncbi:hypothetical protein [Paracoccus kondratievae]|uniref:hypothetical protein n=1 Tax=Paracoccus kondratievae TaxID=135740 RepID=UPI00187911C9|nr:hypothetical protein [Paracoccus kondratievae]